MLILKTSADLKMNATWHSPARGFSSKAGLDPWSGLVLTEMCEF